MFKTVFDASQQSYTPGWGVLVSLLLTAVGALMVFKPELAQRAMPYGIQGRARTVVSWLYFLLALFCTIIIFLVTFLNHWIAVSSLSARRYSVVEGPVTDFVPSPPSGKGMEHFTVEGRSFFYSDYASTAGFNRTASHGGPIHEGLYVRVTYAGNIILRLEVAQ